MSKNIVLFVDDEENILNSIKRAVFAEEFTAEFTERFSVLFATSGAEALHLMEKNEVSVIVTDMMMPDMDGLALLKEAKRLYPMTIRIVLSGHTQLAQVLAAINQGDIFRFITKPWSMEADLFSVVEQGIEYYNLRRDKRNLEESLQQRNMAYKNMLRTLEGKFSSNQGNFGYLQNFLLTVLNGLEQEFTTQHAADHSKGLLKLQLVRQVTTEYFKTVPVVLEEFALQDVAKQLQNYLTESGDDKRYTIKLGSASTKCFGNFKLLMMILLMTARIVCRLGGERTFKHGITSQVYPDKGVIRISNVIEFGYVDGGKVVIDSGELLSHSNLEFYTTLLGQIGQPYEFDIAYTYINQNTSLIAISAEFIIG